MASKNIILLLLLTFWYIDMPLLMCGGQRTAPYSPNPCSSSVYKEINNPNRSTTHVLGKNDTPICDRLLSSGWYRFTSVVGGEMPTTKPKKKHCGTVVPIWMQGTHPTPIEGEVTRTACENLHNLNHGCYRSFDIKVKNCGTYYVYKLRPTYGCFIAYCAGNKELCEAGYVGVKPNCTATAATAPPSESTVPQATTLATVAVSEDHTERTLVPTVPTTPSSSAPPSESTVPQATTLATVAVSEDHTERTLVPTVPTTPSSSDKPVILNDGQNFAAAAGSNINLTCKASSKPPTTITWTRNDVTLAAVSTTVDQQVVTSRLLLLNVQRSNTGEYTCTARNRDGSTTGLVKLIVNVPVQVDMNVTLKEDRFTSDLKNKSSPKYKKLEQKVVYEVSQIYINVTGFDSVQVVGFYNGSVEVQFRVLFVIKVKEPNNTKDDPDLVKIKVANIIINVVNVTGKIGGLKVIPESLIPANVKPPQPRNLTVTKIDKTWVEIEWMPPLFAERYRVTQYYVERKEFGGDWKDRMIVHYGLTDLRLDNLKSGTSYSVKVAAKSRTLLGIESKEEFTTKKDAILNSDLLPLWVSLGVIVLLLLLALFIIWYKRSQRRQNNGYVGGSSSPKEHASEEMTPLAMVSLDKDIPVSSLEEEGLGIVPSKWWEIPRKCLQLGDKLGSGEFGIVSKGNIEIDDRMIPCAVKMLKPLASEEQHRDLFNELEIMANVGSHRNIVNLIGACTVEGPLLVVTEFAERGCLLDYLRAQTSPSMYENTRQTAFVQLDEAEKLHIALDVTNGMKHLVYMKCIHRDLAARNVLLMSSGTAKVSDFGLSRDVYERGFYEKLTKGRRPVRWMAPESIERMLFNSQSDIWSYGVLLWEIETGGKKPYESLNTRELLPQLKRGIRLKRPPGCKQETYNLMIRCWETNPDERPSFEEICAILEGFLAQLLEVSESPMPSSPGASAYSTSLLE